MSDLTAREKQPYIDSANEITNKILAIIIPQLKEYGFIEVPLEISEEDENGAVATTVHGDAYDLEKDIYLGLLPTFKVYENKYVTALVSIVNMNLDDQKLYLNFILDDENIVTTDIPVKKHDMGLFKSILAEAMEDVIWNIGYRYLDEQLEPITTYTWSSLN